MRRNALLTVCLLLTTLLFAPAGAQASTSRGYLVVLAGTQTASGFDAVGSDAQVAAALRAAGGTVTNDLSAQIGVLAVASSNLAFADALTASGLASAVGSDFSWQGVPGRRPGAHRRPGSRRSSGTCSRSGPTRPTPCRPASPAVDVGVLDSGIDGHHPDFLKDGVSNVDCGRGRNSIAFVPGGPGVGNPDPCIDNQFHGTHVAGHDRRPGERLGGRRGRAERRRSCP